VDSTAWEFYAWEEAEGRGAMDREARLAFMKTESPFGRCVWHCDNDVVDHQSVLVEFANGVTATHDLYCATARPTRLIHLVGSRGELEGDLEAGRIVVRHAAPKGQTLGFTEEPIDFGVKGDSHGGGDAGLVADFAGWLRDEPTSPSRTRIEDSLAGHLIAFAADEAMSGHKVVDIRP
jgi:predicted dehydrogenase